jgi:hypothetical protein
LGRNGLLQGSQEGLGQVGVAPVVGVEAVGQRAGKEGFAAVGAGIAEQVHHRDPLLAQGVDGPLAEADGDQSQQSAQAAGLLLAQGDQGKVGQVGHCQAGLGGAGVHRLQQGLVVGGKLLDLALDKGQGILPLQGPLGGGKNNGVGVVAAHPDGD